MAEGEGAAPAPPPPPPPPLRPEDIESTSEVWDVLPGADSAHLHGLLGRRKDGSCCVVSVTPLPSKRLSDKDRRDAHRGFAFNHRISDSLPLSRPEKDVRDQVSYILAFKGTQVISSGLVMSVMAAVKYYLCVHPKEYHSCAADGPGVQDYIGSSGVDFVGSCILVWLAFFSLPFSKTSGGSRSMGQDDKLSNASESEDEGGCRCCGKLRKCTFCCRCCRWDPTRGGRLAPLLCWDIMTFVMSIALFISLVYVDITHLRPDGQPADVVDHPVHTWKDIGHIINEDLGTWNVRVAVFISRTFYAWLSFPFLVFKIPVITSILTHTSPTGYNRRGVCVPFMMRPMPKDA